jgi:hypothetical protein
VESDKLGPCIKQLLGPELAAVGTGAGVTVAGFDAAKTTVERHGDLSVGYRVTATIQQPGVQVGVYVDVVFLGKARNELTITFTGVGAPVDAAVQRQVVAKAGERIDRA